METDSVGHLQPFRRRQVRGRNCAADDPEDGRLRTDPGIEYGPAIWSRAAVRFRRSTGGSLPRSGSRITAADFDTGAQNDGTDKDIQSARRHTRARAGGSLGARTNIDPVQPTCGGDAALRKSTSTRYWH